MSKCVQCGYCCTVTTCPYGEWDGKKKQCVFLTDESKCAKYNEIVADPNSEISPAFGAGCSSSMFNERRNAKLKKGNTKT